jgi:hypothetical protein
MSKKKAIHWIALFLAGFFESLAAVARLIPDP